MSAWVWRQPVSESMLADTAAMTAFIDSTANDALLAAQGEGIQLQDRPRSVAIQPMVWVEQWSDEGGALVSPEVARIAGAESVPSGGVLHMEWA